jgi:uncharacterized protein YdeI (YjbR/CyaY-like superfamily)
MKQAGAKAKAGDIVEAAMERHTGLRDVEVPPELEVELARNARAKATFNRWPHSHRRQLVDWITEAKKPETRLARAAKAANHLLAKAKDTPVEPGLR